MRFSQNFGFCAVDRLDETHAVYVIDHVRFRLDNYVGNILVQFIELRSDLVELRIELFGKIDSARNIGDVFTEFAYLRQESLVFVEFVANKLEIAQKLLVVRRLRGSGGIVYALYSIFRIFGFFRRRLGAALRRLEFGYALAYCYEPLGQLDII